MSTSTSQILTTSTHSTTVSSASVTNATDEENQATEYPTEYPIITTTNKPTRLPTITSFGGPSVSSNEMDLESWEMGSYACLILSIIIPLILIIIGKIYHSNDEFIGCDSPHYMAIFLCFWNIGDFYSDLIFCMILLFDNSKLFIYSLIFILFPYVLSCAISMYYIRKWQRLRFSGDSKLKHGIAYGGAKYVNTYDWLIISVTVIAGFYSAIELVRSKIFYKPMFSLHLKKRQYSSILSLRFVTTVVFELSNVLCLSCVLKLMFILFSLLNCLLRLAEIFLRLSFNYYI